MFVLCDQEKIWNKGDDFALAVGKNTLSTNKEVGYRLPGEVVQFLSLEIVYQNKIISVDPSSADDNQMSNW